MLGAFGFVFSVQMIALIFTSLAVHKMMLQPDVVVHAAFSALLSAALLPFFILIGERVFFRRQAWVYPHHV